MVTQPDWAIQFNWDGKFTGQTADGRPVYLRPESGVIYVFEKNFETSSLSIKWSEENDARISESRSWESLQEEGIRSIEDQ